MYFPRALPFFLVIVFGFSLVPVRLQGKAPNRSARDSRKATIAYRFERGLDEKRDEQLIFPDGVVVKGERQVGRVSLDRVSQLLDEISKAGFFDMQRHYRHSICHQCSSYRIIVRTGKREKTVEYQDGSKNIPAELREISVKIQRLLRDAS